MRGINTGKLMDDHRVGHEVQPGAAKLLGPRHSKQAQLTHPLHCRPGKLGCRIVPGGNGRDLVTGKRAHHLPYGKVMVSEVKGIVHSPSEWIGYGLEIGASLPVTACQDTRKVAGACRPLLVRSVVNTRRTGRKVQCLAGARRSRRE